MRVLVGWRSWLLFFVCVVGCEVDKTSDYDYGSGGSSGGSSSPGAGGSSAASGLGGNSSGGRAAPVIPESGGEAGAEAVADPLGGARGSETGDGGGDAGPSSAGGEAQEANGGAPGNDDEEPVASGGAPEQAGGTTANGGTADSGGGDAEGGTSTAGGQPSGGVSQTGGASSTGGVTVGPGSPLVAPPFDNVPTCTVSKTDGAGQGPFFIHEDEVNNDVSLLRQDIRGRYDSAAEPGTEMQLYLRVLDASNPSCNDTPIQGLEVYVWHVDGQGYWSGFGTPGDQKPDQPYAGVPGKNDLDNLERFTRGYQITDSNGVVAFRSIFPGWMNGRDLHVQVMVLASGSASRGRTQYSGGDHLLTTQFYFEPALTDSVHKSTEPYLRRTKIPVYEGAIKADESGNSGLRAKATLQNNVVVAQLTLLVNP